MSNLLTNQVIINELLSWYSEEEICSSMGISLPTFKSMIDQTASDLTYFKLGEFWNGHVRENLSQLSMADFFTAAEAGKTVIVDTPDEPQICLSFFDKLPRKIYTVSTANHTIKCSNDHLLETDFGWTKTEKLELGMNLLTVSGFEPIISILSGEIEKVYDFEVAHQNHRYWGGTGISSHNSGKSFIASNLALQAQKDGYHVLYLDSEHAIDVDYLAKIGVKVDEEHLTYVAVTTIEDVNKVLSEFFSGYSKAYGRDNMDAPKTLIVLDSLAMLSSSTEMENYDRDGTIKADQGILAKRRKAMLRLAIGQLGRLPIAMVMTDHVYPADIMLGDGAWAITNSTKFSASIIGIVTKLKLKEDGAVTGVRMRFETYKSRFAKLGTKVELEVPYNKGMSSTSGLLELLEEMKVIAKGTIPGEKTLWIAEVNGEVIKFKEKDFSDEIARKLIAHPACQPILARDEPLIDIASLDISEDD